ncbi:TnsD family transposase [Paenibacillus sp. MER TA 81-3]|uniref:TnsD family Tn7-like transposition protein n=1 Tax=Paenibacillus sp. MER TA 81-3 TaxID=2939573 RepID=UPI00204023BC|nr:TnsD family Tn7-like transposition protein [Paenibacillus sp. MER TA 81-3]MCM3341603.1 TnsD family transposase [Paenibacillus sp. MER TA 81-3]
MEITEVSWLKPSTKERRECKILGIAQLSISHLHRKQIGRGLFDIAVLYMKLVGRTFRKFCLHVGRRILDKGRIMMSRLAFFPQPYLDEDFRSIIYRYHLMSPNQIFPDTKEELFELRSHKNPMFLANLIKLYEKLPDRHPFESGYFINHHTWARLISCFLTRTDRNNEDERIRTHSGNYNNNMLNVTKLFSKQVKYCPKCLYEDYEKYGECYVHRAHQFDFMTCCHLHRVELIDYCPDCNCPLSKDYAETLLSKPQCPSCSNAIKVKKIRSESSIYDYQNTLLEDLYTLNSLSGIIHAEYIQSKIMMKMWEINLIHYRGRFMRSELLKKIVDSHSPEILEVTGLKADTLLSRHFAGRFLQPHNIRTHILFYVLLIRYLFSSVTNFLNYEHPIANPIPFGHGPWECLNPICTQKGKKIIQRCERKLKISGGISITTTFQCAVCGFTYSKRWMRGRQEPNKPLIVSMGHLWYGRVETLYLEGFTPYQIHKETGFSETAINSCIKKMKKTRLTLSGHNPPLIPSDTIQANEQMAATTRDETKESYRLTLLQTAQVNQTNKRLFLLRMHPREYNWLCRNDSTWLDEHFPRKKAFKAKIDLHSFDEILSQKIRTIAAELKEDSNFQIRKYTILNRLSPLEKSRLQSFNEDRLPASHKALNESIEKIDSYLMRSVARVATKLRYKYGYQNISYDALISYSKLYESCSSELKVKIEELLRHNNEDMNCR